MKTLLFTMLVPFLAQASTITSTPQIQGGYHLGESSVLPDFAPWHLQPVPRIAEPVLQAARVQVAPVDCGPITGTPEPSSLAMAGIGAVLIAVRSRTRRVR